MLRTLAAASLVLLLSCSGTSAGFLRSQPAGWNHEWARGAVFYEIFVRSFADSNGDGIGDFNGLTAKLDYLTSLGIDGIWLMPIFESPSYHGYDTVDYETIEKDYGTNADFQRFLDEAHKRGIRVILDFVMNHTSSEHPWFLDSASSPSSPKRDWYVWSATDPGWKQPWGGEYGSWHPRNHAFYYGAFWGGMPDLNYRNREVKAEMFRLGGLWLKRGADGYRLDATRYLVEDGGGEAGQADTPGTLDVLKEFSAEVRRLKPGAILIAENTVDTKKLATYFASMPMNFDFPLATAIKEGVKSGDANRIRTTLREINAEYPRGVIDTPFLTNHDHTRIATYLGNDEGKLRSAASILLTLPGTPFIYYGEELGAQNGPTDVDEAKRTPMQWTATGGFTTGKPWRAYAPGVATDNVAVETKDPRSLLSHYRNWIAARKRSVALMKGDINPIDTGTQILAFVRQSGSERVLVVHNVSDSFVHAGPLAVSGARFETVFADRGVSDLAHTPEGWQVSLPPRSSGAWRLE